MVIALTRYFPNGDAAYYGIYRVVRKIINLKFSDASESVKTKFDNYTIINCKIIELCFEFIFLFDL